MFAGRVTVGDEVVRDPARDVTESGRDHRRRQTAWRSRTPPRRGRARQAGRLRKAQSRDPQGRPTVVSLVEHSRERLYPVGRLDADTTGLILLTNDGELAYRLTHPSFRGAARLPRARPAARRCSEPALRRLREGVAPRRRHDGAGGSAPAHARPPRDHPPGGPQAAGAADASTPSGTPWVKPRARGLRAAPPGRASRPAGTACFKPYEVEELRKLDGTPRGPREPRAPLDCPAPCGSSRSGGQHRRANAADAILDATEALMEELLAATGSRAATWCLHVHAHARPRRGVPGGGGAADGAEPVPLMCAQEIPVPAPCRASSA